MRTSVWERLRPWVMLAAPPVFIAIIVFGFAGVVWTQTSGDTEAISASVDAHLPYLLAVNHTIVFAMLLFFLHRDNETLRSIGWSLRNRRFPVEAAAGVVLALGLYLFKEFGLDSAMALADGRRPTFTSLFRFRFEAAELPLMVVATCFIFVEESVYRGYAEKMLTPQVGVYGAWIASSILFGFLHWGNGPAAVVNTAILGALMYGAFLWRKNLVAVTVGHALYNAMVILT